MLTPIAPEDEEAVLALYNAGFAPYSKGLGRENVSRQNWVAAAVAAQEVFWCEKPSSAVILAIKGSTVVIDALVVDPAKQRSGLGRRALALIEDHARASGATEITLYTAQTFTHLVAFYSAAGYRVTSVGPHPKGRDDRLRVFFVKSLV